MAERRLLWSSELDRALRWAAVCHDGQVRKGSGVPYVIHVVGVAMILDRLGYDERVVIAGLLHDVVEDTDATLDDVRARFGPEVASLVDHTSEVKLDAQGRKRPWIDRKTDHIAALRDAPVEARAVVLADKLQNLASMASDLRAGRPVWSLFHAERAQLLWYYHTSVAMLAAGEEGDPKLAALAAETRRTLGEVEAFAAPAGPLDPSEPVPENRKTPPGAG
jgi:guanosine-3',5'-bis(diphosphate) 3'-pyrophosphohydrolase